MVWHLISMWCWSAAHSGGTQICTRPPTLCLLRNRPLDPFRILGCCIRPIPTCLLFSHFQSLSGPIPVGTTYTTTILSDINTIAHPKPLSIPYSLQSWHPVSQLLPQCCHTWLPISDWLILMITTSCTLPVSMPWLPDVNPSFLI